MKDTITIYTFRDEMIKHGFSYEGATALFEYLEQLEEDTDQELAFDPIAFRCDFNEYAAFDELLEDYDCVESLEHLKDQTTVIEITNSERLIIQNF